MIINDQNVANVSTTLSSLRYKCHQQYYNCCEQNLAFFHNVRRRGRQAKKCILKNGCSLRIRRGPRTRRRRRIVRRCSCLEGWVSRLLRHMPSLPSTNKEVGFTSSVPRRARAYLIASAGSSSSSLLLAASAFPPTASDRISKKHLVKVWRKLLVRGKKRFDHQSNRRGNIDLRDGTGGGTHCGDQRRKMAADMYRRA